MCCSGMRLEAGINDLATTNPEVAEEWSVQNGDLTPAMYKKNSREMIWWTCRECGNEWRASIYSRSRGRICPYCSEKIRRENSVFRYRYRRDMMRFENNIRTAVIRFYMKKYGIAVHHIAINHPAVLLRVVQVALVQAVITIVNQIQQIIHHIVAAQRKAQRQRRVHMTLMMMAMMISIWMAIMTMIDMTETAIMLMV